MNTAKTAIEVLSETERRLRDLVSAAAADGDYDAVAQIAAWARTVGALARDGQADLVPAGNANPSTAEMGGSSPMTATSASGSGGQAAGSHAADNRAPSVGATGRATAASAARGRRAPAKGEYPKFFRRGDLLVKIGWSKKEREEYEHKAPRRVAEALAAAIARRSAGGKPFTAEQVFPLTDPQDGSEIPGYQGYVVLAWFKSAGLVKQNGRSGYSVKKAEILGDAVTAAWVRLPAQAE